MQGFLSVLGFYCALSMLPALPVHSLFWGRSATAVSGDVVQSLEAREPLNTPTNLPSNSLPPKTSRTPNNAQRLASDHPTRMNCHHLLSGKTSLPVDGFANFVCQQAAFACSALASLNFFRSKIEKGTVKSREIENTRRSYVARARRTCIACGAARKAVQDPTFRSFLQAPEATAGL